ncbi:MAG TPA: hypothetical protein VGC75_01440 [Candidatus Nitrosocosmicus sp.]
MAINNIFNLNPLKIIHFFLQKLIGVLPVEGVIIRGIIVTNINRDCPNLYTSAAATLEIEKAFS